MKRMSIFLLIVLSISLMGSGHIFAGKDPIAMQDLGKRLQVLHSFQMMQSEFKVSPVSHAITRLNGVGGIAGTLYGLDEGVESTAFVEAFTADSIFFGDVWSKGFALVNPDGSYQIDSLAVGNYYVVAWADGYWFKYYNNVIDFSQATTVSVTEGSVTTGVDFRMEKIFDGTGSISGTIVNAADGHPIYGAAVSAFSPDDPFGYGWAETGEDGSYRISVLRTGHYYISVWADGYLPEFYNDAALFEEAQLVEVIEPNETSGIDFALSVGGSITGRVTDDRANPLAGVYMEAVTIGMDSTFSDGTISYIGWGKGITDENGTYTITGLPTGDYLVKAEVWYDWTYLVEWYDGASTPETATPVSVVLGEETANIDFQLSFKLPTGVISGLVTDLQDHPIPDAFVQLQSNDPSSWFWYYAMTDKEGRYLISNIPDGSYWVSACAQGDWQYVCRWWPDSETPEGATPIIVGDGSTIGSIDFKLPVTAGTASISGTVMSDDNLPLIGTTIQISPMDQLDPLRNISRGVWAWGTTDSMGQYQVDRLPAGTYYAQASHWEYDRFDQQWYDHADEMSAATPVILSDGEKRGDVNFDLTLRPMYGSISGIVLDETTGLPVSRAYVEISSMTYLDSPNYMPFRYWSYYAITDEKGGYQIDWLWDGDYLVSVYANGAFEYFEDAWVPDQAKPVKVTGGEKSVANFALLQRNDGSGVISGNVGSDWDRVPFEIAVVTARPAVSIMLYPQSEMFYTAVTDSFGNYELRGLPAGEYYLMSFAPYTAAEYYDNVYDPSEATPVKVDGMVPTTGIDFTLLMIRYMKDESGFIGGRNSASVMGHVMDINGQPVNGSMVYALDESQQAVSYVRTRTDGSYEIVGLPPGNYILQASQIGYDSQFNGNAGSYAQAVPIQVGSGMIEVNFTLTTQSTVDVDDNDVSDVPKSMELYGNYPNPFNPQTRIVFALPGTMEIKIRVYNLAGEEVKLLFDGRLDAGDHHVIWDGRHASGRPVSSGIYLYSVESKVVKLTGKMLLMR